MLLTCNHVWETIQWHDLIVLTFFYILKDKAFEVGISSLMPLLRDQAHDIATIKHFIEKIKAAVSFLNPTQSPVVTVDQPLFALSNHSMDIAK